MGKLVYLAPWSITVRTLGGRNSGVQVILHPRSRAESNGHRDPSAQLAFSSPIQSRIPCLENGATHSGWVLPLS